MLNSPLFSFCQADIFPLQAQAKTPLHTAWRTNPAPVNGTAAGYITLGYNIGYRIPPDVLIIDIDPRKGGNDSFQRLPPDIQSIPATVYTRDSGRHLYLKLPPELSGKKLRSKVPEFPGIDFLHHGRYVVLPGSSMPNEQGNPASWTIAPGACVPPPIAPPSLLEILTIPDKPLQGAISGPQYLSPVELNAVLAQIPITSYRDNDSWLRILMASHHATQGDGLEVFLQWSLQDDMYAGHEQLITQRWSSMSTDKSNPVTIRSLCSILSRHAAVPTWLTVRAGLPNNTNPSAFFSRISDPDESDTERVFNDFIVTIEQETRPTVLLTETALAIAINSTLTDSLRDILIKQIAKKTSSTPQSIRKDLKALTTEGKRQQRKTVETGACFSSLSLEELENLDKDQLFTLAARSVLIKLTEECHGVSPVFCNNEWYLWDGIKWNCSSSENRLQRTICTTLLQTGILTVSESIIRTTEGLLKILQGQPSTFFEPNREKVRIFTPAHVLDFDRNTGSWSVMEHHSRNLNRYVLATPYLPERGAAPAAWLKFLSEAMTSEQAQRTLACAIVYAAADCRPWLRKCFYLYGPKRSGKSTALTAIESLLGVDNCSALSIQQIGSKHGGITLVNKLANISNEMLSKKAIQDDIFKQLVSGESITVEPKFKAPFSFRNTTKLFFGANAFPKIGDESEATWDRLVVFSFPNSVPPEKADHYLEQKLFDERPAILNWAMQIFAEEFVKDECRSATEMDLQGRLILSEWQETNNPALIWAKERLERDPLTSLPIHVAYHDYTTWCHASGHYTAASNHFSRVLTKVLYRHDDKNGVGCFGGVKLKSL